MGVAIAYPRHPLRAGRKGGPCGGTTGRCPTRETMKSSWLWLKVGALQGRAIWPRYIPCDKISDARKRGADHTDRGPFSPRMLECDLTLHASPQRSRPRDSPSAEIRLVFMGREILVGRCSSVRYANEFESRTFPGVRRNQRRAGATRWRATGAQRGGGGGGGGGGEGPPRGCSVLATATGGYTDGVSIEHKLRGV